MSDHECPVSGCASRVPYSHLACAHHWRKVPRDLQRAVYRAYRDGDLAEHAQGCEDAVAAIEGREPNELVGDHG